MSSNGLFVRADGWTFNREGRPLECVRCGSWEFYEYVGYTRHPVTLKGKVDQPVVRYQCKSCRKTVVQTFGYVGKWKQYAKDVHRTALNRMARDRSSRRHTSRSMGDDSPVSPCESTLRNWANFYGRLARITLRREVFPQLDLSGYQPVHMDEIYTHVAGDKMAIVDAMAHKGYLSLGGKVCNDPSSDDVWDVLEQMDDLLIEPSSFVTDDSAIYPPAFSRLGRPVVHIRMDGHEWTYFLGIPDREDLEARIESVICWFSQLIAP